MNVGDASEFCGEKTTEVRETREEEKSQVLGGPRSRKWSR